MRERNAIAMSDVGPTKILVVDDLPEKLLTYQVILELPGQEVVTAQSGAEALRLVLQQDFAVILLDVNMPGMDGFETAAMIRQRKKSAHTPIIFITAFTDDMRVAKGYAHGAVDYILAPVVPEMLQAKVSVFVDLFRMTQQVKQQADEQIVLAEERSRRAAVEESNRRLSFLARASAILGSSLDQDVTARDLVRLAIPVLADRASLALADPLGDEPLVICGRHEPPAVVLDESAGWTGLPDHVEQAMRRSLATGVEQFLPPPPAGETEPAQKVAVFPLQARNRTFGVLALSREGSDRHFTPSDLTMAEALVSRAAIALDNAQLYKELEHADRQKNEFLSMLAHELRNPLAPIRSAVDVLRLCTQHDSDVVWAQDVIDRQVTHLVRLVDELLDVSRITRGKIRLELGQQRLAEVVSAAVETSRPLIDAGRHQLNLSLPEEPLWVHADEARLAQVLSNLLNNAAKYTPPGGMIWVTVSEDAGQAVVSVRDTGVGIPPEMLSRVFDLFQQVDRSIDRSQGGLGIGLTLARRLVEMHGGSIEAKSEGPGRGSEFVVRLPIGEPPPAAMSPLAEQSSGEAMPSGGMRVLVVDDNIDAASSLGRLLKLRSHVVHLAHDGPTALVAADEFRPDAVLLDLGLPRLNGYDVARRLRQADPDNKLLLIAVSGYGGESNRTQAALVGFNHYFVKPLDVEDLLKALSAGTNGHSLRVATLATK
jgi:signal transduction histidine kinase